jgi:hypothetical protein
MGFTLKRTFLGLPPTIILSLLLLACSEDGTGPGKELDPLVGVWKANTVLMTSQANPSIQVDLVELGATFTLSILSTGQYTASLSVFGSSNTEVGMVTVAGNQITIAPTSPEGPPSVSTWSFQGSTLILDGDSEFDFNLDGTPEASTAHIELDPFDS